MVPLRHPSPVREGRPGPAPVWALLGLVVAMLVSLLWFVDPYFESMWDAVLYVLTTRSLVAGEGYRVYGDPFHLRPPGFAFLFAPVVALFGTDFLAWNLFVSLLGILALALAFLYFHPRLGTPLTFAVCASLWINPQFRSLCSAVLSDTAALAALFGCLLLDRRVRRSEAIGGDLLLGLALGCGGYLRTVTTLLIPAIAFSRVVDRDSVAGRQDWMRKLMRVGLLFAVPFLMQIPWLRWKSDNPPPTPSRQHGIYSYWTAQWHTDSSDPDSPRVAPRQILERIPVRTQQCFTALGSRMPKLTLHGMPRRGEVERLRAQNRRPLGHILGWVGVLCLVAVTLRRRDAGGVFALGSLGVLLIYFDFDERLVVPNYLFVLAATLELLVLGLGSWTTKKRAVLVATLLVTAMGLSDAFPPNDREPFREATRNYTAVARWVEDRYPEDVAIGGILGHELAVFFERPVYFLEMAARWGSKAGVQEVIGERNLRVVVHTGEIGWLRRVIKPLIKRRATLIHRIGDVGIYELDDQSEPSGTRERNGR